VGCAVGNPLLNVLVQWKMMASKIQKSTIKHTFHPQKDLELHKTKEKQTVRL